MNKYNINLINQSFLPDFKYSNIVSALFDRPYVLLFINYIYYQKKRRILDKNGVYSMYGYAF